MCETWKLLLFPFGWFCDLGVCQKIRLLFSMKVFVTIFQCSDWANFLSRGFQLTACKVSILTWPDRSAVLGLFLKYLPAPNLIQKPFFNFLIIFLIRRPIWLLTLIYKWALLLFWLSFCWQIVLNLDWVNLFDIQIIWNDASKIWFLVWGRNNILHCEHYTGKLLDFRVSGLSDVPWLCLAYYSCWYNIILVFYFILELFWFLKLLYFLRLDFFEHHWLFLCFKFCIFLNFFLPNEPILSVIG